MLFEPDEELKAIRARLLSKQQDYRRKQEMARVTGNKTIINVLYGGGNWDLRSAIPSGMVERK